MTGLTRRKANTELRLVAVAAGEATLRRRRVVCGQQVSVVLPPKTTRTRCTFLALVTGKGGCQWVDVETPNGTRRSVHLDAVKTVHIRRSA